MTRRVLGLSLLAIAFLSAPAAARAERDAVQFFENIRVGPQATVHDAVCFFCSVDMEGTASGDIVVFFGSVHIAGEAQHDVVNFFGSVEADDNSTINHDLVSMFGSVRLGNDVKVGQDLVTMFGSLHTADSVTVGNDRVFQPAWVFSAPFLLLVALVWLIVHEVRSRRQRLMMMRQYPPPPRF